MKLIEAEKVVQAIKDYWKAQVDNTPNDLGFEELSSRMDGYLKYNSDLLKTIDELPSAQPETSCSEFPNNCPAADVVPVVRCKDCKDAYCRTYQNWQEPIYTCTRFRSKWNTDYDFEVNPDDFCSYGKRKE